MKLLFAAILFITSLFAFDFTLLKDKRFDLSGKFYYYPFYPKNSPKSAFNWVFESKSKKVYRLMGTEPDENNVFGWKRVDLNLSEPPRWLLFFTGDIDFDNDTRFDWILTPADGRKIIYKLLKVTPQEHYFKYAGPAIADFDYKEKKLYIKKNFAKRLKIPFREHGYSNFDSVKVLSSSYELKKFVDEIKSQDHWGSGRALFLDKIKNLDLTRWNLILYPFSEPSGSIKLKIEKEEFIAPNVFKVWVDEDIPPIGTSDMAYYMFAYLVDKNTQRVVFEIGNNEKIIEIRKYLSCEDIEAPVCGYRDIECFAKPCEPAGVKETFKNYCELKKAGAKYLYDGNCSKEKFTDAQKLSSINNRFAIDLGYDLYSGSGNIIISPYSILNLLNLLYAGANKEAKEQIESSLEYDGLEVLKSQKELNDKILDKNLNFAESIWIERSLGVYNDFIDKAEDFFDTRTFLANIKSDPNGVRKQINRWVEQKSGNKIKNFLPNGSVDKLTKLVLVNAVYFYSEWKYPFDKNRTKKGLFHSEDGDKYVDMMSRDGNYDVFENEELKVIEIPYKNGDYSMLLFLPKGQRCICDLLSFLKSHSVTEIKSSMDGRYTALKMPKFKVLWGSRDISENLKRFGIKDIFDSTNPSLTMIAKEPLYAKSFYHKAFIEVDEKGSEAAAASGAVIGVTSVMPDIYEFSVDRNFLFMIVKNGLDSIIFIGGVKKLP